METYESAEYEVVETEDPEEEAVHASRNSQRKAAALSTPSEEEESPAVLRLIHQRPLLFWGSVWIILVVLSALSTLLLISPFLAKREAAPAATGGGLSADSGEVAVNSDPNGSADSIPWWALGAMAIGCATGSMLISQRLNRSPSARKASKRSKPLTHQPEVTVIPADLVVKTRPIDNPHYGAEATPAEAIVTIVPANETTPLDWDEPSLADLMDVRRRRPLSSWF